MKLTTLITSLALSSCVSCAAPAATSAKPPTSVKSVDKAAKLKALARTCPQNIELSAYIDRMPGPPIGDSPRTAGILLTVIDGTGWAVGYDHRLDKAETTMILNVFRAPNHVKPPARSLKPQRTEGNVAYREIRFRAPSPAIKQVHVTCFGEVIAETQVHTVY